MKYLNTYKLYESFNMQDIEDILLEITDLGYIINHQKANNTLGGSSYPGGYPISSTNHLLISTPKVAYYWNDPVSKKQEIKFDEIKDCIFRLKDYLDDKYCACYGYYRTDNTKGLSREWIPIDLDKYELDCCEFHIEDLHNIDLLMILYK